MIIKNLPVDISFEHKSSAGNSGYCDKETFCSSASSCLVGLLLVWNKVELVVSKKNCGGLPLIVTQDGQEYRLGASLSVVFCVLMLVFKKMTKIQSKRTKCSLHPENWPVICIWTLIRDTALNYSGFLSLTRDYRHLWFKLSFFFKERILNLLFLVCLCFEVLPIKGEEPLVVI